MWDNLSKKKRKFRNTQKWRERNSIKGSKQVEGEGAQEASRKFMFQRSGTISSLGLGGKVFVKFV